MPTPHRSRLTRALLLLMIGASLLAEGITSAHAQTAPKSATPAPSLATLKVEAAAGGALTKSLDGRVEAIRLATLSSQVPGSILEVLVRAGDRVQAGQPLVRIDARAAQLSAAGVEAQRQAAEVNLSIARKELERQQALFKKQYISQGALDRAQASFDAAQAQVQSLQAQARAATTQANFYVVEAPYSGIISAVTALPGDMAMPGRPLMDIFDPSALRVTSSVPESLLGSVSGRLSALRIELPGLGGTLRVPTRVELLPQLGQSQTAELRLGLGPLPSTIVPGSFARVWIPAQADSSTANGSPEIPSSAVLLRGELTAVYVIDANGRPQLRQVRLGRSRDGRVEVLAGLRIGETIAQDPQAAARLR
ncbi:MAG: efflux RND transporter periplasmic adaptor subunit [Burkholderiaceae bacterium]